MSASLPKPVPFRMKPKKKFSSMKVRKAFFYILALLTLGFIIFSITKGDDKKETVDYQLAAPNEFIGIKKGKTSDYDATEQYVDDNGEYVEVEDENEDMAIGKSKKVYNAKNPHIELKPGKGVKLDESAQEIAKKKKKIADALYKGNSRGREKET
ncbi:hypothetical protein DASC09_022280 [Saccharomycopsis crataegensis]|uniref:Uncharacterized protein n=1 Tax=Saccharomycopsis crataegensis TaxID=43959 RepID=A0AAV5QL47_9ASCO|nr:hypothetical protein DASC09_022280 [Saccharomycopsis crataegensis]